MFYFQQIKLMLIKLKISETVDKINSNQKFEQILNKITTKIRQYRSYCGRNFSDFKYNKIIKKFLKILWLFQKNADQNLKKDLKNNVGKKKLKFRQN